MGAVSDSKSQGSVLQKSRQSKQLYQYQISISKYILKSIFRMTDLIHAINIQLLFGITSCILTCSVSKPVSCDSRGNCQARLGKLKITHRLYFFLCAKVHRGPPCRRSLVPRVLSRSKRENPGNEVKVIPIAKSFLTGYLGVAQALFYPTITTTILLASRLIQKRYCN